MCAGSSVLLHAGTGTGKTLTYLLPAIRRIYKNGQPSKDPFQVLVLVPTKELALQVSADILSLTNNDQQLVSIVIGNDRHSLANEMRPVVVGTPYKIWHLLSYQDDTMKQVMKNIQYLVLDEVDRLVTPPNRYVSLDLRPEGEKNPVRLIAELLTKLHFPSAKPGTVSLTDVMQIVGASATVGRPLRRHMYQLFTGAFGGLFNVIRPAEAEAVKLHGANSMGSEEGEQFRQISIPPSIGHVIIPSNNEKRSLPSKLMAIKKYWAPKDGTKPFRRGILFVPKAEDVDGAVNMLRFWKVPEAFSLLATFGLEQVSIGHADKVLDTVQAEPIKHLMTEAQKHGIGTAGSALSEANERSVLYVAPLSGTRGLHVQDIDVVFVTDPPRTMDEYLHVAGRTGRMNAKEGSGAAPGQGMVLTLAPLSGHIRMRSWETPLGITFKVQA